MAMMKCPSCGKPMAAGGVCKNCGYDDSKGGGGKQAPPKKAPGKGKAPAKKGGKVPPQFAKRGTGY